MAWGVEVSSQCRGLVSRVCIEARGRRGHTRAQIHIHIFCHAALAERPKSPVIHHTHKIKKAATRSFVLTTVIVAAEPQIPPNAQSTELASEAEPSEEASALPRGGGGSDPHIDRVFHAAQGGGAGVLGALVVEAVVKEIVLSGAMRIEFEWVRAYPHLGTISLAVPADPMAARRLPPAAAVQGQREQRVQAPAVHQSAAVRLVNDQLREHLHRGQFLSNSSG